MCSEFYAGKHPLRIQRRLPERFVSLLFHIIVGSDQLPFGQHEAVGRSVNFVKVHWLVGHDEIEPAILSAIALLSPGKSF